MHIISAGQFDVKQLRRLFERADYFKKQSGSLAGRRKLVKLHSGRQLATIFFQPSTRTRISFEAAALKLGMGVVSAENAAEHSSSAKGETLEDTIRILDGYGFDAIVMRYFETGGAARAAAVSATPIISAGDGRDGEHPTQAVLDAYTINKHFGRLDNLKIVMGGDLAQSRCVRSLCKILSQYKNNRISFVSTPKFQVGEDVKAELKKSGTAFELSGDIKKELPDADVVYWTRLQAEYLKGGKGRPASDFVIDEKLAELMPGHSIIMHPLPRIDEIDPAVDKNPRAKYFEQAASGLYTRMALIDWILSDQSG